MPSPTVHPDGIRVLSKVSADEVASWIKAVIEQVADANSWYINEFLAEKERLATAEREAEAASGRTQEEMNRLVQDAWERRGGPDSTSGK